MRLIALIFLWALSAVNAGAAQLVASTDPDCMGRFEGQIVVGDLDRFAAVAPGLLIPSNHEEGTGDVTVCLDSPGGSLLEATKIAAYFEEHRIGTVIDDGDACLSACSIIFMLGTQAYVEDFGINRRLHVNGRLGFHRPAFSLPEGGGYSSADVEKSFQIAILATLEFVRLANRMQNMEDAPMIKADLMERMFEHEGEDFYEIDTVDKAGRWQIGVFGYELPDTISEREALVACDNLSNWTRGLAPDTVIWPEAGDLPEQVRQIRYDPEEDGPVWEVIGRVSGMGDRLCQVAYRDRLLLACGGDLYSRRPINVACDPGDVYKVSDVDPLAMFPSATALRDLPTLARRVALEAPAIAAQVEGDLPLSCAASENANVRVVGVENFVNIRSEAAFDASVVAQAPKYQSMEVVKGGAALVGEQAQRESCIAACRGYGDWRRRNDAKSDWTRDRDAAAACVSQNVIWWNVKLPDGRAGWASAKYLR